MKNYMILISIFTIFYSCQQVANNDADIKFDKDLTKATVSNEKSYLSVNKMLLSRNSNLSNYFILKQTNVDLLPIIRNLKTTEANKKLENYVFFLATEYEKLMLYFFKHKTTIDKSYHFVNSVTSAQETRNYYYYTQLTLAFIKQAIDRSDETFGEKSEFAPFYLPNYVLRSTVHKTPNSNEKGSNILKYKLNTEAAIYRFRGDLPWPVDNGTIISFFGERPHPFIQKLKIINNGVAIKSRSGSVARCVFDGTVSKIISIPGANIAVLVEHDSYFSLYSNLKSVYVKTGDRIKMRQKIGEIFSDKNSSILQFQLWYKDMKLNPTQWISRKE